MRAITVLPGVKDSARLDEFPEPPLSAGALLVRTVALGVCGTDREIIDGLYGEAPAGQERLILGHESLGRVLEPPPESDFRSDDLVVGIVRHPDPVPCPACAAGEWDMCRNGRYTEHGIKGLHGFGAELFRIEPEFAVKVDPSLELLGVLMEPTSIVAKAWDHVERIGQRSRSWEPHVLLVTGAGPIGLLAALMGAQRGLEIHIFARSLKGPKADLVHALGAIPHTQLEPDKIKPDVVMECTGAPAVVRDLLGHMAPSGIICLAGISSPGHELPVDIGYFNRTAVLENQAIFGTVNANRMHYQMAADALARADKTWLSRLITRRVPVSRFQEALEYRPDDIKVVIEFDSA
jgi:threonine dehydrogenase-like Zn-dependent dehydrogenase